MHSALSGNLQIVEVWLRTNRRAVSIAMAVPLAAAAIGLLLALGLPQREPPAWLRGVGLLLMALAAGMMILLVLQWRRPRMAYRRGELLLWLRGGAPIEVPIDVVECFWYGQAPSLLPGKQHERTEAAAIVIRIAERAADWRHQEVKPQLGTWCEGYVTIRGTWCEPLSVEVVNRLNRRLAEVSGKTAATASPSR